MPSDQTTQLQGCLDRLRAGDESARNELLQRACDRLLRLTRKMLRNFPRLKRWEQTDDVLQNALMRLCRALQEVTPSSVHDFFRLAALEIRRELLDLSRHYFGPHGSAARQASAVENDGSARSPHPVCDKQDSTLDPGRLAAWTEFHQHVEALPDAEKEIFDLLWYQGLTQDEAAVLLQTPLRTIQRRWQMARLKLHRAMKGERPR
jgi:RNA polymerase sigma-70 factor (ECF subfamily)